MAIRYISLVDALGLHDDLMQRLGVSPQPLRGGGEALLESALMRAQNAAYYERADLIRQAALLAVGISQHQPFVDGNKRTGYYVADVFLRVNGLAFQGDPLEFADRIVAVASQIADRASAIDEFTAWLREHSR